MREQLVGTLYALSVSNEHSEWVNNSVITVGLFRMKVSDAPAHQRCQMITPTSVKQSLRNASASFGSLYALRFPNDHMITPMSVNNSIVNAGLSQMELLGKRLAAVATKFQCVVRWYVRIVIKLCSNFYSVFENAPKKFCKSPDAYWTWTVVSSLFFSSVYFSFFLLENLCLQRTGGHPLGPSFFFSPSLFSFLSLHIFSAFFPFLFVAVHWISVLWLFWGRSFWCLSLVVHMQNRTHRPGAL